MRPPRWQLPRLRPACAFWLCMVLPQGFSRWHVKRATTIAELRAVSIYAGRMIRRMQTWRRR